MTKLSVGRIKVGVGYAFGTAVAIYGLWAARSSNLATELPTIMNLLAGTLGWIVGIFATPKSGSEKKQFVEYVKATGAVASGFGLAKLQSLGYDWARLGQQAADQVQLTHIALFLLFFFLGLLFTFVGRKSLLDDAGEALKKRQKLIVEIREKLDEID
jgi:hypothetical protein